VNVKCLRDADTNIGMRKSRVNRYIHLPSVSNRPLSILNTYMHIITQLIGVQLGCFGGPVPPWPCRDVRHPPNLALIHIDTKRHASDFPSPRVTHSFFPPCVRSNYVSFHLLPSFPSLAHSFKRQHFLTKCLTRVHRSLCQASFRQLRTSRLLWIHSTVPSRATFSKMLNRASDPTPDSK
jgi:hypothetical protein